MTSVFGGRLSIPNGWPTATLDELKSEEPHSCRSGPFGSSISRKYFVDEGVPVIRGSNLTDDLTRFREEGFVFVSEQRTREKYRAAVVEAGDIVVTCWGTVGQVGIIPQGSRFPRYVISNKQLKLRVNRSRMDPLFLFYLLSGPAGVGYLKSRAKGTAVPGINLGILKAIEVPVPPLRVQRDVLRILSAYDDLIENNTRRMALLEASIHLLYREWFVYLRFPGQERVEVLDGVPEGWEQRTLGEVLTLHYGKSLTKKTRIDGPVPVYGSSGVVGSHNKALVDGPGIVVGRKGNVGSVFWTGGPFFPIDTVFYVGPTESSLFVYCLLAAQTFVSSDAAVPGLNRNYAYSKKVLAPSRHLVGMFNSLASPPWRQRRCLEKANQRLREARDALLPRLMDGRITV